MSSYTSSSRLTYSEYLRLNELLELPEYSCIILDDLYHECKDSKTIDYLLRVLSSKRKLHVIITNLTYRLHVLANFVYMYWLVWVFTCNTCMQIKLNCLHAFAQLSRAPSRTKSVMETAPSPSMSATCIIASISSAVTFSSPRTQMDNISK